MKTYKIKKLFNGYASVRDYVVEECIENEENLMVVLNEKRMVLSPEELEKKKEQLVDREFQSDWGGTYKLLDYRFEPTQEQTKLI